MQNIFFFQTQQIPDSSIFNQFKEQKIFYSYFQVDQNYYLFFYAQESIDIHFLYQSVQVIQELDSKQRKIRSFRGFFLYALEIIQNSEDYEILNTNLQPFFWRKVQNIIRQNKKGALLEFLFGYTEASNSTHPSSSPPFQELQNQVDSLAQQVERLQQKIIQLESKLDNPKYALSETSQPLEDSNLKTNNGSYSQKNNQGDKLDSNTFSKTSKIECKASDTTQEYNVPSNQDKGLQKTNFNTLGKIPEQEKIEIIKTGFQRQADGIISLKKYYESTQQHSLFQLKGYYIKYEAIRKNKLYQQLKL